MKGFVCFLLLLSLIVSIECKKEKGKKKCITSEDLNTGLDESNNELKEYINGNKCITSEYIKTMLDESNNELKTDLQTMLDESNSELKEYINENKCSTSEDLKTELNELNNELKEDLQTMIDELKNYINESVADLEKKNKEPAYDCTDIQRQKNEAASGVYSISQHKGGHLQVFCDMETDNGGWTVFQRRQDGSVDFFRGWSDYVNGFGAPDGEVWMGLEAIYQITSNGLYELRIDLESFDGEKRFALYSSFSIDGSEKQYTLHLGACSGNAGDALAYHNGMKFTTKDKDNDNNRDNCANKYTGAWWYNSCHVSNLNGVYYNSGEKTTVFAKHVVWYYWLGHYVSLKKTEMKIRKKYI